MAATVPVVVPTVAEAAAAFLDTCTAPSTRRSYTQTMTRLIAGHGTAPVTALDGETLRELLTTSWDGAAPATWNRHLATLGSFTAYAVRRRWLEVDPATGLQRRKEIIDRTRRIDTGLEGGERAG
jgi:site-specific recombinase XerC